VGNIAPKSRAEYMKQRRKATKAFYVEIESAKMEKFESKLADDKKTKKEWLNERIDEELGK
jgi:hypothetical protein